MLNVTQQSTSPVLTLVLDDNTSKTLALPTEKALPVRNLVLSATSVQFELQVQGKWQAVTIKTPVNNAFSPPLTLAKATVSLTSAAAQPLPTAKVNNASAASISTTQPVPAVPALAQLTVQAPSQSMGKLSTAQMVQLIGLLSGKPSQSTHNANNGSSKLHLPVQLSQGQQALSIPALGGKLTLTDVLYQSLARLDSASQSQLTLALQATNNTLKPQLFMGQKPLAQLPIATEKVASWLSKLKSELTLSRSAQTWQLSTPTQRIPWQMSNSAAHTATSLISSAQNTIAVKITKHDQHIQLHTQGQKIAVPLLENSLRANTPTKPVAHTGQTPLAAKEATSLVASASTHTANTGEKPATAATASPLIPSSAKGDHKTALQFALAQIKQFAQKGVEKWQQTDKTPVVNTPATNTAASWQATRALSPALMNTLPNALTTATTPKPAPVVKLANQITQVLSQFSAAADSSARAHTLMMPTPLAKITRQLAAPLITQQPLTGSDKFVHHLNKVEHDLPNLPPALQKLVNQAFSRMISPAMPMAMQVAQLQGLLQPSALSHVQYQQTVTGMLDTLVTSLLAAQTLPASNSEPATPQMVSLLKLLLPNLAKTANPNQIWQQLQQPSAQNLMADLNALQQGLTPQPLQVQNATPADNNPLVQLFLPLKLPPEHNPTQLTIGRYKKHIAKEGLNKEVWFVRLTFDYANQGQLSVQAQLMEKHLDCELAASSSHVSQLAQTHLDGLKRKLQQHGLQVGELHLKQVTEQELAHQQQHFASHAIVNIKV